MPWMRNGSLPDVHDVGEPSEPCTASHAPVCQGAVLRSCVVAVSKDSDVSRYTALLDASYASTRAMRALSVTSWL